ncbi:MAG: diguanylate cyclase/phosphodiesterase (GGDEF & EAL domains) with PAS/PAC sensor(s), partial [uncultured Blastococcus sp.]
GGPRAGRRGADPAARGRCRGLHRRLRHRLLQPGLPRVAAGHRAEAGPGLRGRHDRQLTGDVDRHLDPPARARPRPHPRRRGRRGPGDRRRAGRPRLRRRPGLPPQPSAASRAAVGVAAGAAAGHRADTRSRRPAL